MSVRSSRLSGAARRLFPLALALILGFNFSAPAAALSPLEAASDVAAAQGQVTDARTGQAVAGAAITAWDGRLNAVTDAAGRFAWPAIPVAEPETPITLTVRAAGFGAWTIQNARLLAGDTLQFAIPLSVTPVVSVLPLPGAEPFAAGPLLPDTVAPQAYEPLPAAIRVRVTGNPYCNLALPYTVQTVDFREYVKHVLPNEWGAWHIQSLRAGAMAVKMYGWAMIARGGKWPDADVYDSTCDQVYNPAITYAGASQAVDDTWPWRLTRAGLVFATYYRAYYSQCLSAGLAGNCLGQWESKYAADAGQTWDQILLDAYSGARLSVETNNYALRFYGDAAAAQDRVQLPLTGPARAVNVGAADFTLEWWLKADPAVNMTWNVTQTITATCGVDGGWLNGSVLFDRDVWGAADYGEYGLALVDGRVAFGINNGLLGTTLCGRTSVADKAWHHVALTRRRFDGQVRIYVDGRLDLDALGPPGDLSYRVGRTPAAGGALDPFLMIGGPKTASDPARRPAFNGWLDEVRFSDTLRYTTTATTTTTAVFTPTLSLAADADTVGLYHFDEPAAAGLCLTTVADAAPVTTPAPGVCLGAAGGGPAWVLNDNPLGYTYVRLPVLLLNWPPRLYTYLPLISNAPLDLTAGLPAGAPSSAAPPDPR